MELLQRTIEFQPAKNHHNSSIQIYNNNNNKEAKKAKNESGGGGENDKNNKKKAEELFTNLIYISDTVFKWNSIIRVGQGMRNLGNTCFFNSIVQCLTYCAPFANLIRTRAYLKDMPSATTNELVGQKYFLLDLMAKHVIAMLGDEDLPQDLVDRDLMEKMYSQPSSATPNGKTQSHLRRSSSTVTPMGLLKAIFNLSKGKLRFGRQEDAHEAGRIILDAMHADCLRLNGMKATAVGGIAETTMIYRVFGGTLQSQLKCRRPECGAVSNTFDKFLDISLDIRKGSDSLQAALKRYTAPEILDKDNRWRCGTCQKLVCAAKQLTIKDIPNVLVVHFKRFAYGPFGGKINSHVEFPLKLDIKEFTSEKSAGETGGVSTKYQLVGVLVHSGYSTNSGHYYCYVKAPNDFWYEMNDESVNHVKLERVLAQNAYMVFYQRVDISVPGSSSSSSSSNQVKSANVNGTPQKEKDKFNHVERVNGESKISKVNHGVNGFDKSHEKQSEKKSKSQEGGQKENDEILDEERENLSTPPPKIQLKRSLSDATPLSMPSSIASISSHVRKASMFGFRNGKMNIYSKERVMSEQRRIRQRIEMRRMLDIEILDSRSLTNGAKDKSSPSIIKKPEPTTSSATSSRNNDSSITTLKIDQQTKSISQMPQYSSPSKPKELVIEEKVMKQSNQPKDTSEKIRVEEKVEVVPRNEVTKQQKVDFLKVLQSLKQNGSSSSSGVAGVGSDNIFNGKIVDERNELKRFRDHYDEHDALLDTGKVKKVRKDLKAGTIDTTGLFHRALDKKKSKPTSPFHQNQT